MRKATWGAIALAIFALHFGSPLREIEELRTLASVAVIAGYLLLSYDPPIPSTQQRKFLIAGILASVLSFVITVTGVPYPAILLARVLAVATVALPLWLVAGPARYGFIVAGALALVTGISANAELYVTSIHAYVAMVSAFAVAGLIHDPTLLTIREKKPPRLVVASNIVTMSSQQKTAALANIEKRFKSGEIPEHQYWDLRQEIESR